MNPNKQICKRCIYDSDKSSIEFDDYVCNYCEMIDDLKEEYGTGKEREKIFEKIIQEIKKTEKVKDMTASLGLAEVLILLTCFTKLKNGS